MVAEYHTEVNDISAIADTAHGFERGITFQHGPHALQHVLDALGHEPHGLVGLRTADERGHLHVGIEIDEMRDLGDVLPLLDDALDERGERNRERQEAERRHDVEAGVDGGRLPPSIRT